MLHRSSQPLVAIGLLLAALSTGLAQESATNARSVGSVEGRVLYIANPQRPWRLGRYYIRNAKSGELAEAVVGISQRELNADDSQRKPETFVMDQKDFQFVPETLAIRAGDSVKFLNSDNHAHNVKSAAANHSFNVTMPVGGEHIESFATATGVAQPYKIDCVFHTAMRAWVFVFDHPWFQVTGVDGTFKLENVPVGDYRLEVNHPAGDLKSRQNIHVDANVVTQIEVRLSPPK